MTCELLERARTIADPRRQCANLKHRLDDVLVLGFCGVLAGCDDFVEMADWAGQNLDFFRTFLELPGGVPSHDTFNRVFAAVKPDALQAALLPWLLGRRGLPGDWVHLDGKTMRHTGRASRGLGALHAVSAWAGQAGLTLGQRAVDAKSNEITAIPLLLQQIELTDAVATIDAMGCQKEIARAIVEGGGDYVLAVKDNQPKLREAIAAYFLDHLERDLEDLRYRRFETSEAAHGRTDERSYLLTKVPPDFALKKEWPQVKAIGYSVRLTRHADGRETDEVRY